MPSGSLLISCVRGGFSLLLLFLRGQKKKKNIRETKLINPVSHFTSFCLLKILIIMFIEVLHQGKTREIQFEENSYRDALMMSERDSSSSSKILKNSRPLFAAAFPLNLNILVVISNVSEQCFFQFSRAGGRYPLVMHKLSSKGS